MRESDLLRDVRLALAAEGVIAWRNNVGVSRHTDGSATRYGLCVGSSDVIGVLPPSGRFIALELKVGRGKTTREQDMFLALVRQSGGFAAVVRSVDDAVAAVRRAQAGESE